MVSACFPLKKHVDGALQICARTRFGLDCRRESKNTRPLGQDVDGRGTFCVPKMILAVEIAIFATAMVQVKSSNDAFEKQISQHKTWQGHVATLDAGWFWL